MSTTKEQVLEIAKLAKLKFNASELDDFTKEFQTIIEFADQISACSVDKLCFDNQNTANVFREDIVKPSFERSEIIKNAPEQDGEYFIVPRVLE